MSNYIGYATYRRTTRDSNGFHLEEVVGSGSSGSVVYRGRSQDTGKVVALKTLPPFETTYPEMARSFWREEQLTYWPRHEHVITMLAHGIGEIALAGTNANPEQRPLSIQEYAPGGTLKERMNRRYRSDHHLSLMHALQLWQQAIKGMAFAHKQGIVHRDLKPENMLIKRNGNLALADFGLAINQGEADNPTEDNMFYGSLAYMAPEAFKGIATVSTDIYAMGVVGYELSVGRRPFQEVSTPEWFAAHCLEAPPAFSKAVPAMTEGLRIVEPIVRWTLGKKPAQRPLDMEALSAEVDSAINQIRALEQPALALAATVPLHVVA